MLVLTTVRPVWRNMLLDPDALPRRRSSGTRASPFEPSITRLILIGVILIVLMNARPQGLVGTRQGGDRLMAERLLDLRGVSKSFGGLTCIDDLDLHVDEHEILSVIGPNGAGKTTLFNLITGVYAARLGRRSTSRARACSASSRTRSSGAGSRGRSRRCGSS